MLALTANLAVAATPKPFFQSALITGAANTIAVSRVPVQDSNGIITYKDVTLRFTVSDTGELSLAAGSPSITNSPNLIASQFKAGNYQDSSGNIYKLTGPSVVPGTTRTVWSLALISSANKEATLFSASWITGPIKGHPNQPILDKAKITSTIYSWGSAGSETTLKPVFPFNGWGNYGHIVGAAQAGDGLALHLFRYDSDNIEDGSVSLVRCATTCK